VSVCVSGIRPFVSWHRKREICSGGTTRYSGWSSYVFEVPLLQMRNHAEVCMSQLATEFALSDMLNSKLLAVIWKHNVCRNWLLLYRTYQPDSNFIWTCIFPDICKLYIQLKPCSHFYTFACFALHLVHLSGNLGFQQERKFWMTAQQLFHRFRDLFVDVEQLTSS
jgi:hypothetical protein